MKRFIFLICIIAVYQSLEAEVYISFNAMGPSKTTLKFSNINWWVEYQFDSTGNFNSPIFRTKISKGSWTDTVMGLRLNKTYYFRSRQVRSDGTVMSNWVNTTYNTARYPLAQFINSGNFVNYVTYPLHKFTYNYFNKADFWYDVSPDFNSPLVYKTSRANDYSPIYLPMYGKYDTLYIRAKVDDDFDSLPWKTVMLVKAFKPILSTAGKSPCNDSSKFNVDLIYNFPTTFSSNTWKTYVIYKGQLDSFAFKSFSKSYELTDNSPFTVITNGQFSEDTFSGSFTDTTLLEDPLKLNQALNYKINTVPNMSILIYPGDCNTGIELELHSDSTYSNLLSTQYKNNKSSGSALQFLTNWSYFDGSALRYRIIRCGIKGKWFNIPTGNYKPSIGYPIQLGVDTTNSSWTISHNNYILGKQLEIEHDIHIDFITSKKRTYIINDTSKFKLESLFGNYNFVRCRIIDGTYKSQWSNTVSKKFTLGSISKPSNHFTQPSWICQSNTYIFSGLQMRFGHSSGQMKYMVLNPQNMFTDIYDFADGDTVYYQLRLFTPIDTSSWSIVFKHIFKGSVDKCFVPWINYNGYQNGLDTFLLSWKDKNPVYTTGFKIYLGPSKREFKGEIELPKTQSSFVIVRKSYPSNWYFALYPACVSPMTYTTIEPEWYPLNGQNTNLDMVYIPEIYYSLESGTVFNNSETAYSIKLYDNMGRLIMETSIEAGGSHSLSGINEGIYHIQYDNQFKHSQQSILIQ